MREIIRDLRDPVRWLPVDLDEEPTGGVALCLSGGGYRAMLFHTGVLWRLHETGWLQGVDRIASVSGGAMTAAVLGTEWDRLRSATDPREAFAQCVVPRVRSLASVTIDWSSIVTGLLLPLRSIGEQVERELREHLVGDAVLADLPQRPKFILNATNTGSGNLVRFTRDGVADWRVGRALVPSIPLSAAVAASAAFPPLLSPYRLDLRKSAWRDEDANDLGTSRFRDELVLTDGGVYDNLALETAWKRCRTIFVSDAGGELAPDPEPATGWAQHTARVAQVVVDQVRSLRRRQTIESFADGRREGTYVGIGADIRGFGLPDALEAPTSETAQLADVPTRLAALAPRLQERLINWGYAVADAGLRAHLRPPDVAPPRWPYPGGVA